MVLRKLGEKFLDRMDENARMLTVRHLVTE